MTPTDSDGKAAIIGAGVIGAGWAARFLLMGWHVAVHDPAPDAARKISEVLENARRSLPGLYDTLLPKEGRLEITSSIEEAVKGADWVQESAPERLAVKQGLLSEIQSFCPAAAVIASSTSGFRPSELQAHAKNPAQIIVAHPFNPVYLIPLVELVGAAETVCRARDILDGLGMRPVHVRHEIDAHVADRLLEAVWREALWLVHDGIATTGEIDDIIIHGFGLRWAQMGLFDTYRVAGGEAGMKHFMAQFGPALKWPWTKLMDVPELDTVLIDKIARQSDSQSGVYPIREFERIRDDNLVSILRALKLRDWGAGRLLNAHDKALAPTGDGAQGSPLSAGACSGEVKAGLSKENTTEQEPGAAERFRLNQNCSGAPIISVRRVIPVDWVDYNGHMTEARYGQVFSDAADAMMQRIGADADYIASGMSFFTVDTHVTYKDECPIGARIHVRTQVLEGAGKKMRLFHEMCAEEGAVLATCEQLLIHVSLKTRRACLPGDAVAQALEALATAHGGLPHPLSEGGK